jgi:O-antigen/teichoic acid export membrane protein
MIEIIDSQLRGLKSILVSKTAQDSFVMISGDLLVAAIGFISSLIVIKSLGPTDYGLLAISMAVMGATSQVLDLGIRTSAVRFISLYLKTDKEKAKTMLEVVFRLRLIIGLITFAGGFLLAETLAVKLFNKPELINLLRLAFMGCFGALIYDFVLTDLQAHQSFKKLAGLGVIVNFIKVILIIFLVLIQTVTISKVLTVYILTPFLGFLIGSLLIRREFMKTKGNCGQSLRTLFQFSKWVMISYVFAALYNRAEVFLLAHFEESTTVGIYSAAHTLVLPVTLLCLPLTKVLLPKVTSLATIPELSEYLNTSIKLLTLMGILMVPYYFLAPFITELIGNRYLGAIPVFRILFFNALIIGLAAPIVIILYSLNKPHVIAFINIGQFCFSFTANYFVIPYFGAVGAAVVTLCSFGSAAVIEISLVFKYLKTEQSIIKIE